MNYLTLCPSAPLPCHSASPRCPRAPPLASAPPRPSPACGGPAPPAARPARDTAGRGAPGSPSLPPQPPGSSRRGRGRIGKPRAYGSRDKPVPLRRAPSRAEPAARRPLSAAALAPASPHRPGASFATALPRLATRARQGTETLRGG